MDMNVRNNTMTRGNAKTRVRRRRRKVSTFAKFVMTLVRHKKEVTAGITVALDLIGIYCAGMYETITASNQNSEWNFSRFAVVLLIIGIVNCMTFAKLER